MQKADVKRGRGRPKKFTSEEIKEHRTVYMLTTPWYCHLCKTDRNYTLAGKTCHTKTKKHRDNLATLEKKPYNT